MIRIDKVRGTVRRRPSGRIVYIHRNISNRKKQKERRRLTPFFERRPSRFNFRSLTRFSGGFQDRPRFFHRPFISCLIIICILWRVAKRDRVDTSLRSFQTSRFRRVVVGMAVPETGNSFYPPPSLSYTIVLLSYSILSYRLQLFVSVRIDFRIIRHADPFSYYGNLFGDFNKLFRIRR